MVGYLNRNWVSDRYASLIETIYVSHDHDRGAAEILLHRFAEEDVLAKRIVSKRGKLNILVSCGMASAANRRRTCTESVVVGQCMGGQ